MPPHLERIDARRTAGASRRNADVEIAEAARMETTQSAIARLESGRGRPSTQTLERLALATGTKLTIRFEPHAARP